jgi:hypothetical protein
MVPLSSNGRHDPARVLENSEQLQLVQQIISQLSEQQRLVLHLRDFEHYSYDEIETVTEMTRNNIRVTLSRARKYVREQYLKREEYGRPKINVLLEKYYQGEASLEEEARLRKYLQRDDLPRELEAHAACFADASNHPKKSNDFDPFSKIEFLKESQTKTNQPFSNNNSTSKKGASRWLLRIAAGFILLLMGFAAGQLFTGNDYASNQQVAQLEREVQKMKRTLMNPGLYQNASTGERLSAINYTSQIASSPELDEQITDILIHTMNNDENVNVRLAAAQSLYRFKSDKRVKQALVNSLNQQDNALMQITLIDMLVELKANGSVTEMEKLLVDSDTQDIVRQRLQAGIAELQV